MKRKEQSLTLRGPGTCTEIANKNSSLLLAFVTPLFATEIIQAKNMDVSQSMLLLHCTKGSNCINTLLVHSIRARNHTTQTSHKTKDLSEDKTMLE